MTSLRDSRLGFLKGLGIVKTLGDKLNTRDAHEPVGLRIKYYGLKMKAPHGVMNETLGPQMVVILWASVDTRRWDIAVRRMSLGCASECGIGSQSLLFPACSEV